MGKRGFLKKPSTIIFCTCFFVLGCDSNDFSRGLSPGHMSSSIEDEFGNKIVSSYVLVALKTDFNANEALRLAKIVNGKVIGNISELNIWQIEVNSSSSEDLDALIALLEKESSVRYGMVDFEVDGERLPQK
ncbi:S8 family serine peptidase [Salinimonas chungwhensis]|uniref:S8 family serine peptidase n=1 Tax=Salinimonas chungwhensis TaxID=265425 RepID=UPI0003757AD0|nr:hypothetical protein [Salinimonas chungwhensis]